MPNSSGNSVYFTDRSRQVAFQKCPRLRFLGYELGGRGIQPSIPSLDMELGKGIHEGVALLLAGKGLEEAIAEANHWNHLELPSTLTSLLKYSQLQEGLIRAFFKTWYPKLKEKFRIIGKPEQEMVAPLDNQNGVLHMSRPDAVLQDKVSGDFGVWSIKTTSFNDRDALELEYRTDVQGYAEMWAAEQHFQTPMKWSQMFFIFTGRKEVGEEGIFHQSPVYLGWWKDDGFGGVKLAHSYWWKEGKEKKGLGKGWQRFNVAEQYEGGIQKWIDDLGEGKIQPEAGNPLEDLFFCPPAHYRDSAKVEEWRISTLFQEDEIWKSSALYNDPSTQEELKDYILARNFPKHQSSCIYMKTPCMMYQLCHGTAGELEDPFNHGFAWRKLNHPQEGKIK